MATLQRGRKPESVQFWLAIAALSLAFHSLFLFGIQRWAKVAVLQPEVSGPIDVELVAAAPAKSEVNEGAIAQVPQQPEVVPQTKLEAKPQPVESEPEVVQKPDPKREPEPKRELPIVPVDPKKKPPIVEKPKPKPNETPSSTPKNSDLPEQKPASPKPVVPVTSGDGLPSDKIGGSGTRSVGVQPAFEPEQQSSSGDMPSTDNPPSQLKLKPHPGLSISQNSPLLSGGKSATIDVRFAATCPISAGNVCDPTQVKLQRLKADVPYTGPASTLSPKDLEEIDKWATEIVSKASVQSLTIQTPRQDKPDTFWSVTFQLR